MKSILMNQIITQCKNVYFILGIIKKKEEDFHKHIDMYMYGIFKIYLLKNGIMHYQNYIPSSLQYYVIPNDIVIFKKSIPIITKDRIEHISFRLCVLDIFKLIIGSDIVDNFIHDSMDHYYLSRYNTSEKIGEMIHSRMTQKKWKILSNNPTLYTFPKNGFRCFHDVSLIIDYNSIQ